MDPEKEWNVITFTNRNILHYMWNFNIRGMTLSCENRNSHIRCARYKICCSAVSHGYIYNTILVLKEMNCEFFEVGQL